MMSNRLLVDNNCYATRIVGEPQRGGFIYLAVVTDNRENTDVAWVKENTMSSIGVSLFNETPIIVRDVVQRLFPGDIVKLGKKRMKTYVLNKYGDFLVLEQVIKKAGKL